MNAFFWSRKKSSKEIVEAGDAMLVELFPNETFLCRFDSLSLASTGSTNVSSRKLVRDRVESADVSEPDLEADGEQSDDSTEEREDGVITTSPEVPPSLLSCNSGSNSRGTKTLPKELERYWSMIRQVFHVWDEKVEQAEREQKMKRMAALLMRYRVMERVLMPKILHTLTFETRKCISHVFRVMTVHNLDGFVGFLLVHPSIIQGLVEGYKYKETGLICGSMLRDCLLHESVALMFLTQLDQEFKHLFDVTLTNTHFDVSGDAFMIIHRLLMDHKQVTGSCLEKSFDRIFGLLNELVGSSNYVTKRQALQLLAALLLDSINFNVMQKYISSKKNLKLIMMCLREPSHALRMDAFHVFKIFVANPNKSKEVEHLLVRNRDKLLHFVKEFGLKQGETSRDFLQEKQLLIFTLERMEATIPHPPLSSSSSCSSDSTESIGSFCNSSRNSSVSSSPVETNSRMIQEAPSSSSLSQGSCTSATTTSTTKKAPLHSM
jgi:calcium binding protein 39